MESRGLEMQSASGLSKQRHHHGPSASKHILVFLHPRPVSRLYHHHPFPRMISPPPVLPRETADVLYLEVRTVIFKRYP